ncbi:MAG: hypothetical protein ABL986_04635 [Vicinamibacterales bacterium]
MNVNLERRVRGWVTAACAGALLLVGAPAFAQVDIAGEWATRTNEDQPHRAPGADLGDYTGIPINAAARQKASVWDASILSEPESMAKPHAPQYFMRGPGPNIRITKVTDPVTQVLIAYTIEGSFGRNDRVIWMDGRPHPSERAEHTWDGFSTGKVEGNRLTVTTTHMKYGILQRNGVPSSPEAVMTEHFVRHGNWLTDVIIVDDPTYLEEPFIRTSTWELSSNITPDQRFIFEVVDEIADRKPGYVPASPLGTRQEDFAKKQGLPFEGTQGGKVTTYPEYEAVIRKQLQEMAARQPASAR